MSRILIVINYDEYSPPKSVGLLLTMTGVSKIHSLVLHRKAQETGDF